ncbi:MAG: hypothetical protein V1911_03355 [Candidatus Micrarchaeota archaeon]
MREFGDLSDLIGTMKVSAEQAVLMMDRGEEDKKMLLFYSLGYLSDMYIEMAEDALKKGEEYPATKYSAKAEEIRQVCISVFGKAPEQEYYKGTQFKIERARTALPIEQIMQIAQVCASNIQPDQEIVQDPKEIISAINELFRIHPRIGVETKLLDVLKKKFSQLKDKPPKLEGVYEILLLLKNVNEIQRVFAEEQQKPTKKSAKKGRGKRSEPSKPAHPRASSRF